jgi:putative Mn2+ efflux pump MntP
MLALLILALALAMDALAVSLVRGSAEGHNTREALKLGLTFGLAQGLMPLVGWLLGVAFADTFRSIDHWVAFSLLGLLGLRMLYQGVMAEEDAAPNRPGASVLSLAAAAFATSIDAAVAGITLPFFGVAIWAACLIIGLTTAALCTAGYMVGGIMSRRAGKWAEIAGGIVLLALGTNILVEHLSA